MNQIATNQSTYSFKEEFWNATTHGVGAVLTIPATYLLIQKSEGGISIETISYIIFGISMFCLYLASTLYHCLPTNKTLLKKLDHSSIFLLIAGTYTPIALCVIGGQLGWTIFFIEWGLAVCGIVLKQFFVYKFKVLSLVVYLAMGWVAIIVYKPILAHIGFGGFAALIAGGLSYTVGTYFYKKKSIPYNHAIWHLFVMGGSIGMYITIYCFI